MHKSCADVEKKTLNIINSPLELLTILLHKLQKNGHVLKSYKVRMFSAFCCFSRHAAFAVSDCRQ